MAANYHVTELDRPVDVFQSQTDILSAQKDFFHSEEIILVRTNRLKSTER